jgi:predicted N-formylglutamate amidohydrolase
MAGRTANNLLGPDDPAPFGLFNAAGRSPFLLIGDHAGSKLPATLGDLGLSPADRSRHIAIDIGTYGLGLNLARLLDAPFLNQVYSRLVIDCNREPDHDTAIPTISDGTSIPGNQALDAHARTGRVAAIHSSYHAAIAALIADRQAAGYETILLSLHSFTPVMDGVARPWDVGVLHWKGRTDFARAMLDVLRDDAELTVGDNEPYQMDGTDYTVPLHAFPRDLAYAEIEVRQDLVDTSEGQAIWASHLSHAAQAAYRRLC